MIKVENLTKYYGNTRALHDISFSIKKGTIVGFLGPNGAGKTTAMKILTGFMPATSGSVSVGGYDIYEHSREVRENVGYLPENAPLYTDLNVEEYLSFIADMHRIPPSRKKKALRYVYEVCGIEDKIKTDNGELSKGYRQRVGLAAALIHDPAVLILDEPTSGLDPNQIIEIRGLIKKIGSIGKKTVILSTHILPEVESTCDYALIINKGEIVAKGTTSELRDLATGARRVNIEVEGSLHKVESILREVPGVIKVLKNDSSLEAVVDEEQGEKDDTKGIAKVIVEVEKGKDLRKALGLALYTAGLPILELKQEEVTLESVFTQLTTDVSSRKR